MRLVARLFATLGLCALALGSVLVMAGSEAGADTSLFFVSPSGAAGAADLSCFSAAFSSIQAAVAAAPGGATVIVCPGTYSQTVTVSGKPVHLRGFGATIDASGLSRGVVIEGPATAGSSLQGFQVEHAQLEGVLVEGTSQVTIADDVIVDNDLTCQPQPSAVADCGEGLHLEAVTDSVVSGNQLRENAGGVLLDDGVPADSPVASLLGGSTPFAGPTSGNRITFNLAEDNPWDCGITLASHNSSAVSASGSPQPTLGGVFDNTVLGNASLDNGVNDGNGSGILLAAPLPGMGTYDNLVVGNRSSGNGLAGITIHSHDTGQDVNGNRLVGNLIGQNAVDGGSAFGVVQPPTPGDSAAGLVGSTAGIVIWSAATPITGTTVVANAIFDDNDGIWMHNTAGTQVVANRFFDVTSPVVTA
jgi:nitrous oxidase accessory protein NosD